MTVGVDESRWVARASAVRWKVQPFINGAYRPSRAPRLVDKINPAVERCLFQFSAGSDDDVDAAVVSARSCFEEGVWSERSSSERAVVLHKLADLLVEHQEELALLDTLEMGKPISASLHDAAIFGPSILRSCANMGEQLIGTALPLGPMTLAINTWEPRGVIGAITPWNFPIVNAVIKAAPALAVGATLVLKPSEIAPSSSLKLAELALEAGVPEGVFNVVPGLGSTVGAALASHRDVDFLSFTGSTPTGRKIMELAARSNGKPVLLECGGKSPQVVFEDVEDLEYVAESVARSFLWNSGQVCSAHTKLIVQEHIKAPLLDSLVELAASYHPGNPLDESTTLGPLSTPAQRDRVKRYIGVGLEEGAKPLLQGKVQDRDGCYVWPSIFDHVRPDMAIARDEIFGPVLCIQSFRTEAEAIALANGTEYGLAATVWTKDMGRAKRLARRIRAGHISVRTSGREGPTAGFALSHEPRKASGFGAELGPDGLRAYSTLKAVTFMGS